MRALRAALASAALGLACAHPVAFTPLPSLELAPLPEPEARLVLIGDAGTLPGNESSVLAQAKDWLRAHGAPTAVVFLGDNFYPERLDPNLADVLDPQRELVAGPGAVTFVPGNHDWHAHGFRLLNRFERSRIDALAAQVGNAWQPSPGELGPATIVFDHNLFRLIAIDSERWRIAAGACERAATQCPPLRDAEQRLAEALACEHCAPAVVVAHHPLRTVGEHGGCELSWLRGALKLGGQDVRTRPYQAYIASVSRALASRQPLLFAAGHDHSLQFVRDASIGAHVVSGAGANRSQVCGAPSSSWSRNGFVTVDFTRAAPPLLRVFARADDRALREVLREPLAP